MNTPVCRFLPCPAPQLPSFALFEVFAPGRVNLIGEHTDYNGGKALPFPIQLGIRIKVYRCESETQAGRMLFSSLLPESSSKERVYYSLDPAGILPFYEQNKRNLDQDNLILNAPSLCSENWHLFVLGALVMAYGSSEFLGSALPPLGSDTFCFHLESDLPLGAGLSSSAALSCALLAALGQVHAQLTGAPFDLPKKREDLARRAMSIEHIFIGTRCGLMDQTAICFGMANAGLVVDFSPMPEGPPSLRTIAMAPIFKEYVPVIFQTGVSHSLASTKYNLRRLQCEIMVEILNKCFDKQTKKLGEWTNPALWPDKLRHLVEPSHPYRFSQVEMQSVLLPLVESQIGDWDFTSSEDFASSPHEFTAAVLCKRASHAIVETLRVDAVRSCLAEGNRYLLHAFMGESHESLRLDYEVSCPELDTARECILRHSKDLLLSMGHSLPEDSQLIPIMGPRMMGGGFGGGVIALVHSLLEPHLSRLFSGSENPYLQLTGKQGRWIQCSFGAGLQITMSPQLL